MRLLNHLISAEYWLALQHYDQSQSYLAFVAALAEYQVVVVSSLFKVSIAS